MSAFIVGKKHIDYMISAGLKYTKYGPLRWYQPKSTEDVESGNSDQLGLDNILRNIHEYELTEETADAVGRMLWMENHVSVAYRYGKQMDVTIGEPYRFERQRKTDPVVVLKAIACYEYQSCEDPEWETSQAKAFCNALRSVAISNLPGYDAAPWEIT